MNDFSSDPFPFSDIRFFFSTMLQGDKEIVGTLRGFDEYVNMVLEDVVEYEYTASGRKEVISFIAHVLTHQFLISLQFPHTDRIGSDIVKWSQYMHDGTRWVPVIGFCSI